MPLDSSSWGRKDIQGMALFEWLVQIIFAVATIIAFLAGLVTSSLLMSVYIFAGGFAIALIVGVPDWPWYNRSNVRFLPPLDMDEKAFIPTTLFEDASAGNTRTRRHEKRQ